MLDEAVNGDVKTEKFPESKGYVLGEDSKERNLLGGTRR